MKCATAILLFASLSSLAFCQGEPTSVRIRAVLVDKDLNQKPVPRLNVNLTSLEDASASPASARTSLDRAWRKCGDTGKISAFDAGRSQFRTASIPGR